MMYSATERRSRQLWRAVVGGSTAVSAGDFGLKSEAIVVTAAV